jgi:hypothetical protein
MRGCAGYHPRLSRQRAGLVLFLSREKVQRKKIEQFSERSSAETSSALAPQSPPLHFSLPTKKFSFQNFLFLVTCTSSLQNKIDI